MDPEDIRKELKKWLIIGAFFGLAILFYALRWRGALLVYVLVVAALAVLAILVQSGRGGGLAASLGGLGGESMLGTRSATPIARATYVMLALFIFISMLSARLGTPKDEGAGWIQDAPAAESEMDLGLPESPEPAPMEIPAAPAAEPTESAPPGEPAQDD